MTHAPAARKRPGAPEDDDGDSDTDSTIPPPDGGWGWMVVWASFMIHIVTDGVTYSFGVMVQDLVDYFNAGEGPTSLIMAILVGVTLCSGPIASALVNKWGCRAVTIAGALLSGFCLAVSFFATNVATLYVTIGVGAGFGFGLIYLPAIVSVTCYFEKYRSLATGIAVAGSGIGTFIFAPFMSYLLTEYGSWRYVLLILAGLVFNTAIMGALFRPLEKPRKSKRHVELQEMPTDKSELKLLLNGDLNKEQQANQMMLPMPTNTQARSAHNIPTAVRDAQAQSDSTVPRNVKVLSLNLSATPHQILSSGQNHHHHHHGHHGHHHNHPHRHKSDIARLALSQPALQTMTGSVSHLAGSGLMYRKDIFYRGSLVNIPHHRSAGKLSRHTSAEGLVGTKGTSAGVESPDSDSQLTVCGCIPCSPETKDTLTEMLDLSLFKDVIFILFTISNFLTSIGFYMPYTFLKSYSEEGVGLEDGSWLVSVIGIANTLGRLVLGYASDKPWVNRLLVYNVSLTLAGFGTVMLVFCNDFWSLAVCASIFGFTIGAYVGLTSVILVDLLGLDKLTNAFGLLLLFQGLASIAGPPIGGFLKDATKSFTPGFWVAGVAMSLSGLMLFVVPPLERRLEAKKRQACKQVVSSPTTSNGNAHPQPV